MSALRQRMIENMRVRNFSPRTQEIYVDRVARFAKHFGRSPERLGPEEIRTWQAYLINNKSASWSTLNQHVCALRFLYRVTLGKAWVVQNIPGPKKPVILPVVLSPDEISRFFENVSNLKHRAILMTAYAAGLRVSEVASLQVHDIDSQRMMIRIEQGKGSKDRLWATAHKRSYVPEKVMCRGITGIWRRYQLLASAFSCDLGRALHITMAVFLGENAFEIFSPKEDLCWKAISSQITPYGDSVPSQPAGTWTISPRRFMQKATACGLGKLTCAPPRIWEYGSSGKTFL